MPRHVPAAFFERRPPRPERTPAGPPKGSGFHYTELGPLVEHDPASAAVLLRAKLAAARGNASEVARQEGVVYKTVARWIKVLTDKGLDPRPPRAASATPPA
jgi:hypothetical protein